MSTKQTWATNSATHALERGSAVLVVFLLPIRAILPPLSSFVSGGTLLAALILVVTLSSARQYRYARLTTFVYAAALISAPLLIMAGSESHTFNTNSAISTIIVLIFSFVNLSALLWARINVGVRRVALAYSAGLTLQVLLTASSTVGNTWKFGLAFPVTIFVLALLYEYKRPVVTVLALAAIAGVSAFNDYRSFIGFCAVVIAVFIWRWRSQESTRLSKSILRFAAVGLGVFAIYQITVNLALSGLLGYRNQVVTAAQIRAGGSVLNAGRVESGAAWELFLARPLGFGPGAVPNADDVGAGQAGLLSSGVDIDGSYVRDYLFGGGIKLHSVMSDLWVSFGLAGLLLAALFAFFLVRAFAGILITRTVPALSIFLVTIGIWDLAFSPIGTNLHEVIFSVAMLLPLASSPAWFQPGLGRTETTDSPLRTSVEYPGRRVQKQLKGVLF